MAHVRKCKYCGYKCAPDHSVARGLERWDDVGLEGQEPPEEGDDEYARDEAALSRV